MRFQALRYCGTAATILAELSGNVAFGFWRNQDRDKDGQSKVRGFFTLFIGLFLLSVSWDRLECFPFSHTNFEKFGSSLLVVDANCLRIGPMLLPFLSGFLGCYERDLIDWGAIRQLGRKRVQLISLFFTTAMLFFPAVINLLIFEAEGESVSIMNLSWSLANTVFFGVLMNEWYSDEKWLAPRDSEKEFLITFACTIILELVYFPELSLWGLLICGLLLWAAVRQLSGAYSGYVELGAESADTFSAIVMKPIRHILSERRSRKIALFLMINTSYMVVEFVAGFMSNSLGLISDACHMLFDCAALAIGLYASYISRLPANGQFNYGRGRFEVLSGYVNAVFLVLVGALIVLESIERILDPQEISTNSLLVVSVGGLLVNVVGLIFFHEEHHHAHGGSCPHSHSHSHYHSDCLSLSHSRHDHTDGHAALIEPSDGILISKEKCLNEDGDRHAARSEHHECHHGCHRDDGYPQGNHDHGHRHHDHDQAHGNHHHGLSNKDHDHSCTHLNLHRNQEDHHHHHQHHHHDHHKNVACESSHYDHRLESSCYGGHDSDSKNNKAQNKKHRHLHIDHNMEGIFLHVLADTMGSVGVVISTLLIKYKGWLVADPACSIFMSVLIVSSVIPLLRNSAEILLQRVSRALEQDLKAAVDDVMKIEGFSGIQKLHVWSLTNVNVTGTLHLHISPEVDKIATKALVYQIFQDAGIKDIALQIECIKNM